MITTPALNKLLEGKMIVEHACIITNEDNPRTITAENFEKLVQSICDFPEMLYKRPLVVVSQSEEGSITLYKPLGGNMRHRAIAEAMARLKMRTDERSRQHYLLLSEGIPVDLADEWTPEQRKEFVIKDNVGYGQWDWDMLSSAWDQNQLTDWGLVIPDFRFKEKTIEPREDNYNSKVPEHPHTILGDIYELNGHRLSCGDSKDRFAVTALMAGAQAHLCVTSPPYWVGKDYEYQNSEDQIDEFIGAIAQGISLAVGQDRGRVVINTGTCSIHRIDRKRKVEILPLLDKWQSALRDHGWLMRHLRIWVKRGQLPASISPRTDVIDQHNEYVATFEQEWSQLVTFWDPEGEQRGQERIGTPWAQQGVWDDVHGEKSSKGHNAAFPVAIPARNILLYTQRGEIVYEPFSGSGTTLIASEQLHRLCYANELNPGWCDVAVKRYVSWMRSEQLPFTLTRNGMDISQETWIYEP